MPAASTRRRRPQMQKSPVEVVSAQIDRRLNRQRNAKPSKTIREQYPALMERAARQLTAFEQHELGKKLRFTFPKMSAQESANRSERILEMNSKQYREYLEKLNPAEQRITQLQMRKEKPTNVNVRMHQTIRVQKRKGESAKSVALTNYGKFAKLFTDPAGREWNAMDGQHQERMAEYVLKTVDRYISSTKHTVEEGPLLPARRLRVSEVRERRLPAIMDMTAQLARRIESDEYVLKKMKKTGNDPVMTQQMEKTLHGMKNRLTILKGVIEGLETKRFETVAKRAERKHAKKISQPKEKKQSNEPRQTIPFPGARALERIKRGGVSDEVIREWLGRMRRTSKPLTQEEVREATWRQRRWWREIEQGSRTREAAKRAEQEEAERKFQEAALRQRELARVLEQRRDNLVLRAREKPTRVIKLEPYTPQNAVEEQRQIAARNREAAIEARTGRKDSSDNTASSNRQPPRQVEAEKESRFSLIRAFKRWRQRRREHKEQSNARRELYR